MYLNNLFNIFCLIKYPESLVFIGVCTIIYIILNAQLSNTQFLFCSIINIMFSCLETRAKRGFLHFKYLNICTGTPIIQRIGVSNIVKILSLTSFTDLRERGFLGR